MAELDEAMENQDLADQERGYLEEDEFGWQSWRSQKIRTMRDQEDFPSFEDITAETEGRWEDPDPPGGNPNCPVLDWKWPEEVWDAEVALFKTGVNGSNASDIKQGACGDCWFLAAVSVIAMYPDVLRGIIVDADEEKGVYCCRFYADDESERRVCVDTRVPTNASVASGGRPCYVRSADQGELWPVIIEKAFAKVYGSFEAIEGGFTAAGFASILGRVERNYMNDFQAGVDMADPETLWGHVADNLWENGFILGCSWVQVSTDEVDGRLGETKARLGLVGGHAYGIMGMWDVDGTRLIKFRNPWGNDHEWRGPWGDGTAEWEERPEVAEAVGYTPRPDGTFHMSLADFAANLKMLGAARAFESRPDVQWEPSDEPEEEDPEDLSAVLCDAGDLTFTTSGNRKWRVYEDDQGARSGEITDDQVTKLVTRVQGPGRVSFEWKVSSEESYDGVIFMIDGERKAVLTGEVEWQTQEFDVGEGRRELSWVYVKDVSDAAGDDLAAVANVAFAPDGGPAGGEGDDGEEEVDDGIQNLDENDENALIEDQERGHIVEDEYGWRTWRSQKIRTMRTGFAAYDDVLGALDGGRWADPAPPRGTEKWPSPEWAWPEDVWPGEEIALFKTGNNGSNASDIAQGMCGTCYFLAAVQVIATYPELLRSLLADYDEEAGVYCFRFYDDEEDERLVCVDCRIPVSSEYNNGQRPLFCRSRDKGELWPVLLEKAFAKAFGSYQKVAGGFTGAALAKLLGRPERNYFHRFQEDDRMRDPDALWGFCNEQLWDSGFILGCSWIQVSADEVEGRLGETQARQGLIGGHAYGIMGMWEVDGVRLVKFRNPWGDEHEWQGAWGDGRPEWEEHPEVAEAVGYQRAYDGTFFMSVEDFAANVKSIGAVRAFESRPETQWDGPGDDDEEGDDLSVALCEDGSLAFTSRGAQKWFPYAEERGARSGDISDDQTSRVQTSVMGPGTVTFEWMISSEECYDYMTFAVDGEPWAICTGAVDWEAKEFSIPEGPHIMAWIYHKDISASAGNDMAAVASVTYSEG